MLLMRVFNGYTLYLQSKLCPLSPQARGEVPKVPNGVPEKSSGRPDRPRARDRPKPRRRPRPKDPSAGEATTRRSRSAPEPGVAQGVSHSVPQPPSHTAHHEGFLFRKLDIETMRKSSNRWASRFLMGESDKTTRHDPMSMLS